MLSFKKTEIKNSDKNGERNIKFAILAVCLVSCIAYNQSKNVNPISKMRT